MPPGAASWILCCCSLHPTACAISVQGKSDYFLDSADRIHFFIEKSAADEDNSCRSHHMSILPIHLLQVGLNSFDPMVPAKIMRGWQAQSWPEEVWCFEQGILQHSVSLHGFQQRWRCLVGDALTCHNFAAFQVGHGLHVLAPWQQRRWTIKMIISLFYFLDLEPSGKWKQKSNQ